jgi:hypothetical protein
MNSISDNIKKSKKASKEAKKKKDEQTLKEKGEKCRRRLRRARSSRLRISWYSSLSNQMSFQPMSHQKMMMTRKKNSSRIKLL